MNYEWQQWERSSSEDDEQRRVLKKARQACKSIRTWTSKSQSTFGSRCSGAEEESMSREINLSDAQIIDIFTAQYSGLSYAETCFGKTSLRTTEKASNLATKYNIDERLIYSIWDRTICCKTTDNCMVSARWTRDAVNRQNEMFMNQIRRIPGRPKGSKDKIPRKKRVSVQGCFRDSFSDTSQEGRRKNTCLTAIAEPQDSLNSNVSCTGMDNYANTATLQPFQQSSYEYQDRNPQIIAGEPAAGTEVEGSQTFTTRLMQSFSWDEAASAALMSDTDTAPLGSAASPCPSSPDSTAAESDPFHNDWAFW